MKTINKIFLALSIAIVFFTMSINVGISSINNSERTLTFETKAQQSDAESVSVPVICAPVPTSICIVWQDGYYIKGIRY